MGSVAQGLRLVGILLIVVGLGFAGFAAYRYYTEVQPAIDAVSRIKVVLSTGDTVEIVSDRVVASINYVIEVPDPRALDGTSLSIVVGNTSMVTLTVSSNKDKYSGLFELQMKYEELVKARVFYIRIHRKFPGVFSLDAMVPIQKRVDGRVITLNTRFFLRDIFKRVFTPSISLDKYNTTHTRIVLCFDKLSVISTLDLPISVIVENSTGTIYEVTETFSSTEQRYSVTFTVRGQYAKAHIAESIESTAEAQLRVSIIHQEKNIVLNTFYIILYSGHR